MSKLTNLAIDKLAAQFDDLDLTFHEYKAGKKGDVISFFPGGEDEDILVCVFKGKHIHEPFHRQDFFFINFAYHNSYEALSANSDDIITIHENECYISQPYCGYALRVESEKPSTIIGVLIRRETFFREYLSALSRDSMMFRFWLDPQTNRFSDEFIHLSFTEDHAVRSILENMAVEYADKKEDTQSILKPMTLALLLYIARRYRMQKSENEQLSLTEQITRYISDHVDNITLSELSKRFSYHPNYISALIRKETGKTFKQLVLEERMRRAVILMKNTTLSVEEIAVMLGYSDQSNFYKAFREFYGVSPREYDQTK